MQTIANKQIPPVPPINKLLHDTALDVAFVVRWLALDGFNVIKIEFETGFKPTVHIQSCLACTKLIERGEATYYRMGGSGVDRYRIGQFQIRGVRVLWTERGH
jgi:hypothetical protein